MVWLGQAGLGKAWRVMAWFFFRGLLMSLSQAKALSNGAEMDIADPDGPDGDDDLPDTDLAAPDPVEVIETGGEG